MWLSSESRFDLDSIYNYKYFNIVGYMQKAMRSVKEYRRVE